MGIWVNIKYCESKTSHMTDVISYRTDSINQLKELANNKSTTVSTLSAKIIEDYLNYFQRIQERKFVCMPREMVYVMYDVIDESNFEKLINFTIKWASTDLKMSFHKPDLDSIFLYIQSWFDHNGYILNRFDSDESVRFVCRHDMNKNWSEITSKILVGMYKEFGYDGVQDETESDFFAIKVSKKSSKA